MVDILAKKNDEAWKEQIEKEKTTTAKPDKTAEPLRLIIELHPNNDIRVSGPISDKILCYGLLEVAKDVIRTARPVDRSANRRNTKGAFGR